MKYQLIILALHNFFRWLVLLFLFLALFQMLSGWIRKRDWHPRDLKAIRRFSLMMTLQFVLGILLFFLPNSIVQVSLSHLDLSQIVKNKALAFFILIHPGKMLIALILAHATSLTVKKISSQQAKFIIGSLLLLIITSIILTSIPWHEGIEKIYPRPLFRSFFQ